MDGFFFGAEPYVLCGMLLHLEKYLLEKCNKLTSVNKTVINLH